MTAERVAKVEEGETPWRASRRVEVYEARDGWRWHRLIRKGRRIVAESGEAYTTLRGAENAAVRENPGLEIVRAGAVSKQITLRGRCSCGASFEVTAPEAKANLYAASFWRAHEGDGHGEAETTDTSEEQGSLL